MEYSFINGAICTKGSFFEEALYNVSNEKVSAVFDGKGSVQYYAAANEDRCILDGYSSVYINGKHIDVLTPKTVKMLGRKQTVIIELNEGTLTAELMLSRADSGVFARYLFKANDKDAEVEACLCTGNTKECFVFHSDNVEYITDNSTVCAKLSADSESAAVFLTFDKYCDFSDGFNEKMRQAFDEYDKELSAIEVPEGLSEAELALYYSAYFCSLENYKSVGEYKGFMAGHSYLSPMRTYYRDSYYTVLPMYSGNTDKIRNQIMTLAMGIAPDGTCPSAVKSDYSAWWGNHYDSPSFFVMMLYDYVMFTKDTEILHIANGELTVFQKAQKALEKLSECERENGLLYKEGRFNKRDWADEVNRWGYVTYDELLYARANYCIAKLFELTNDTQMANLYMDKFVKVKSAINSQLWDREKGYYVNFTNEEFTEDNLSIDTVFAALFDIADENMARRMLENMEKLLEVRNNNDVSLPDFGVMSVYPTYSRSDTTCRKSSQAFNYHNGANWPYLSAMYALAKRKYGYEYEYVLTNWFEYNLEKGNYTPIEYFSPVCPDGSLLQAWSGAAAFVMNEKISRDFF